MAQRPPRLLVLALSAVFFVAPGIDTALACTRTLYVGADNTVIMFCTEVLEVYEAADRAHVVVDGGLSRQIVVGDYPHVEALATEISRMERHARDDGGARRQL